MKLKKSKADPLSFEKRVRATVARIKKGDVLSYGEVACLAGSSRACRAVGNILKKNHDPKVPCHRVVLKSGLFGNYNRGSKRKEEILRAEGVFPQKL